MVDIAVGTKVFLRTEKLQTLLESIERTPISRVYVADGGDITADRQELYDRDFDFELRVVDLEYNAGLGKGRKEIVKRLEEEKYLLIVDSDMEVPENVTVLADQLAERPDLGGIAGSLVEPEKGRIFQNAKDFRDEGDLLVRSADLEEKEIEDVSGYPFVEFQFVPNAAMFRTACLDDYCWDPEYVIGREHLDFYVGHWKKTDWRFGISPSVMFNHYPGGDANYKENRNSQAKLERSKEHFRQKWGYDVVRTDRSYWFDTDPSSRNTLLRRATRVYRQDGIGGLIKKSVVDGPRILKNSMLNG